MRRALLVCAAITFAIACTDNVTEPVPERTTVAPAGAVPVSTPVAFATTTTEDGLSISTDKDDYQPGDVVHFTGYGWQPGDVLDIVLTDDPLTHEPHRWTVEVGPDGTFQDATYTVDEGDLFVTFTLVATSRASGRSLTVVFTDAAPAVNSFTINATTFTFPASPNNAPASNPITVITGATLTFVVNGTTIANNGGAPRATWKSTQVSFNGGLIDFGTTPPATCNETDVVGVSNVTTTNHTFTVSAPAIAGTYDVRVRADQDDGCNGGGFRTLARVLIVEAPTTTTLSALPTASQTFGSSVTFTANVKRTSDNALVGEGIVRFYDGGNSCSDLGTATQIGGNVTPSSGVAQVTTSGLSLGAHTIRACYLGATAAFRASEASLAYSIIPAQAGTTLAVDPATGVFGGTADLKATLMAGSSPVPGKVISFTLNGAAACGVTGKPVCPTTNASGVATLTGVSLSGINAGTYENVVNASFTADATHQAASGSANLIVNKADQTIIFGALANKVFGDPPFPVGATASSGLDVAFGLGSSSVGCSISGNSVTITGATGTDQFCTIVASQAGNENYNPAPSVSQSFTIAKAPTSTVVETSKTPTVYGEPVTFTATVSATPSGLSGTVTFRDGLTVIGNGTLTCGASCTALYTTGAEDLGVGPHNITAAYNGNANFDISTSSSITQNVNPASTTTALAASSYTATYGDANVALSANVTADGPSQAIVKEGTVKFTVKHGTTEVGSITGSVSNGSAAANFPLFGVNAGSYTVAAEYLPASSTPKFLGSTAAVPAALTIARAETATSISSLSSAPYYVNGAVTVNFSVAPKNAGSYASAPTGTVTVNNSSTPCSATIPAATSCNYTPITVGAHNLTASYAGDVNFLPSNSDAVSILVKYKFDGLFAPVDRLPTVNSAKAGQAIPLKWRLTDANDQPITSLTVVNVKIGSLSCGTSPYADAIEEYAAGSSGLQNLGGGNYQFNWKTPSGYATQCKTVGLDFGGGYVEYPLASFQFKK